MPVVLPDGRFLRIVLRRCRNGVPRPRHRLDQARQASRPRHSDVRRADRARRRISASPDRAGPPGRGLRAARRSGGGEKARRQKRGAPRRGAAGHVRHADRGFAARRQAQQFLAGDRALPHLRHRGPFRAGLDRHLDQRVQCRRMRAQRTCRRDRAHRAGRDHRRRRGFFRRRACALSALAAGGDAAHPRRVRRRHGGAAAGRVLRRGDDGVVRRVLAHRADRRGRRGDLCRAHPDRQAAAAVAAGARGRRRHARHRPGDARQSGAHSHALRRAARLAVGGHRPHGDRGRLALVGAAAGRAADRSERNRAPARCGRGFRQ